MKSILLLFGFAIVVNVFGSSNANAKIKEIQCSGYVYKGDSNTGTGMVTVFLETNNLEEWVLNDIEAGENQSSDPTILELDTYSSFFSCSGAQAKYDSKSHTLRFKYKYDSGLLGGGCQRTSGTFKNCTER